MRSSIVHRAGAYPLLALLAATILAQMGFVPISAHAQTPFPPNSILSGKLLSGQYLSGNEQLVSPNGKTRLIMQYDGNLCMYRVDNGQFLWESGLHGADKVHLQEDGDLVMQVDFNTGFEITWHTDTGGNPGAILVLRDDGNLVIVDTKGTVRLGKQHCLEHGSSGRDDGASPDVGADARHPPRRLPHWDPRA